MDNWESALGGNSSKELERLIREEVEQAGAKDVFKKQKREIFDDSLTTDVKKTVRDMAVLKKLVPERYKECRFSEEMIMQNIKEQNERQKNIYTVEKFSNYKEVCYSILSEIRTGRVPSRSWLIGAPNGFGKASFVNECIMTMEEKSMKAVPYISLMELAEVKVAEEHRLLNEFQYKRVVSTEDNTSYVYTEPNSVGFTKVPIDVTGHYSWSEYMSADCLFCYLTDIASKQVESRILYHVLNVRGNKGLPTIVMTSSSMVPYLSDKTLKEFIWDEIMDSEKSRDSYDRVKHVSCYKVKRNIFAERE